MNLLWKALIAAAVAAFFPFAAHADYSIVCDPDGRINSPPGTLVSITTVHIFNSSGRGYHEDLGPGATMTSVTWDDLTHSDPDDAQLVQGRTIDRVALGVHEYTESLDRVFHQALTGEELNALDDPPPSPFTTVATVTFSNDDGKTATCSARFDTRYLIYPDEPEEPEQQPVKINPPDPIPVLQRDTALAPAGITVSAFPEYFFTDVGTNMRFVSAHFQSKAYYDADKSGLVGGILEVTAKSAEDLEAMGDYTPPNPFWITVRLKVTNDEGFSTVGTVTYETSW